MVNFGVMDISPAFFEYAISMPVDESAPNRVKRL